MLKYILITDKAKDASAIPEHSEQIIVTPTDFIANTIPNLDLRRDRRLKVINLCSNYDYQSKGYYCSLLSEARGLRCVPSVQNIIQINWKRNYQSALPELDLLLEKTFREPPDEPLSRTYFIYFGRIENEKLEPVARRIFDMFRFPLMSVQIQYGKKWHVKAIENLSLADIPDEKTSFFSECLQLFTGAAWGNTRSGKKQKSWLAILSDPNECLPPSNKKALQKFYKAGRDAGVSVEFITKHDFSSLLEYDSLFIRETTSINHHTYRMAYKAESEGIPAIDDPQSIIRCCNKVFLYELLDSKKISIPKSLICDRRTDRHLAQEVEYPVVLKIPDGSFSRGTMKADNPEEFAGAARELLKNSEIIILQEFIKSDYDWRVGILNGQPIFACKYYMAKGHWQILNHQETRLSRRNGDYKAVPVRDVPPDVLRMAERAANLIGNGFYGVDLKETDNGIYVMEVNDNPNVDSGIEDAILGDHLYKTIIDHFRMMADR